jgi:hypothetical protein
MVKETDHHVCQARRARVVKAMVLVVVIVVAVPAYPQASSDRVQVLCAFGASTRLPRTAPVMVVELVVMVLVAVVRAVVALLVVLRQPKPQPRLVVGCTRNFLRKGGVAT